VKEDRTLLLTEITRHWLLNAAVEFGVPLTHLFPEVSQALNVKPVPDCGSEAYASGLMELFDLGMITFSSVVEGDDTENRAGVRKILERFRTLSKEDTALRCEGRLLKSYELRRLPGMQVYFELTPRGGEAWEKIARPDWSRCVSVSSDLTMGELISPNRDLLFAYLGWFRELQGEKILRETIDWKARKDFKIVYWKRLPFVYHASFQVQPVERPWLAGEPQWFRDCRKSVQSWYTEPWNQPDWPVE
jgi:hypothetical protein